jgi:predicted membrane protein
VVSPPGWLFWGAVFSLILALYRFRNNDKRRAMVGWSRGLRIAFYCALAFTLGVFLWGVVYIVFSRVLS